MLNFDSNHSFIEGNLNDKNGKKTLQKLIVEGLIVTNLLTFSGCAKDVPCDVNGNHAHYYVSDDYMGRYIASEKSFTNGLNRSDDYILVSKEEENLLDFINKNDLYDINVNKGVISDIVASQKDYKEYRYSYTYSMIVPVLHYSGNKSYYTYLYVPTEGHSWTDDLSHDGLTGEERSCHYVYYGYKIIRNEKGKYELVKSEPVDSILDLPEGFDYIKEKFYTVVNLYNKDEILNYEDGPVEENGLAIDDGYDNVQDEKVLSKSK